MADRAPTDPDDEPGGRGRLTIASKVYERIATIAATEVAGVAPPETGNVGRLLGRSLPRASSSVAGDRVRLATTVATVWPAPLAPVSSQVRDRVAEQVSALTGRTVDAVDVSVSRAARGPLPAVLGPAVLAPAEPDPAGGDSTPPAPAHDPRGATTAVAVGLLVALALVALGVVAARDALLGAGAFDGSPWLVGLLHRVMRQGPDAAAALLGLAALVLGIVLLVLALRPRSRPAATLAATVPVHLAARDVSRLASRVAQQVPGVLSASAVTGRRIAVRVSTTGDNDPIADAVTAAVQAALVPVRRGRDQPFEVRTSARSEG